MKEISLKLFVVLVFFLFPSLSYGDDFETKKVPMLIAHAGGALNGQIYLNSKEAVENAIQNGFQYIELDLLATSDGDLVAAHDWKMFHELTGFPTQNQMITAHEASQRKILGNQTVLTSKEIYNIFAANKNIYLITDKIQNIDLLNEKFADFKNRIIIEVFSIKKYKEVQDKGFFHPAFCVGSDERMYQVVDEHHIDMITLSADSVYKNIKWYKKHPEVTALAFNFYKNIANNKRAVQILLPYIKGWYTDFLTPKMFQEE